MIDQLTSVLTYRCTEGRQDEIDILYTYIRDGTVPVLNHFANFSIFDVSKERQFLSSLIVHGAFLNFNHHLFSAREARIQPEEQVRELGTPVRGGE